MRMKVGTYNIQHCVDRLHLLKTQKVKLDVTAICNVIEKMDVDICGLNEVWNHPLIEGMEGECNQTEVIAKRLGYQYYVFAKAIPHGKGGEYGNGFLSKYPILSTKCIPLHIPVEQRKEGGWYEDRALLVVELDVNGKMLTVLCTHLGLPYDEIQLGIKEIRELVKECKTPLILIGDMNFFPTVNQSQPPVQRMPSSDQPYAFNQQQQRNPMNPQQQYGNQNGFFPPVK